MIKWFKNKKFRTKLIIGLGAIITLMLVAITIGYYGLVRNDEQFGSLHSISEEALLANEIQEYLLKSRANYEKFLFDSSPEEAVAFENNLQHMKSAILSLKEISGTEERIVYISDIERSVTAYEEAFERIVEMNDQQLEKHYNLVEVGNRLLENLRKIEEDAFANGQQTLGKDSAKAVEYLLNMRFVAFRYYVFHYESDYLDYQELMPQYKRFVAKVISASGDQNKLLEDTGLYGTDMSGLREIFQEKDVLIETINELSPEITFRVQSIVSSVNDEMAYTNDEISRINGNFMKMMVAFSLLAILMSIVASGYLIKIILLPIQLLTKTFNDIAVGSVDLSFRMDERSEDEFGVLSKAFNHFMIKLKEMMSHIHQQNWMNKAHGDINAIARDKEDLKVMSSLIISYLCDYLNLPVGTIFLKEDEHFVLNAGYGYKDDSNHHKKYAVGEGIIGQVAATGKGQILRNIPSSYLTVETSLGQVAPSAIMVVPCQYDGEVMAVVEVALLTEVTSELEAFFEEVSQVIGAEIYSTQVSLKIKALLEETLIQAEELQVQREELEQTNEELAAHTLELERQQALIEEKADDLEVANRYKTEFLANMSHELRTPLNSILVLSELLATRNPDAALTEKEQSFAKTIHTSGKDLLNIINDILDLSKVEAGHLDIVDESVLLKEVVEHNDNLFRPLAESKGIDLKVDLSDGCPDRIRTDGVRLNQILKNLLSNAIKFTSKGYVGLKVNMAVGGGLCIEIEDTGIGISKEKQDQIFEAFKQSDGTTSRKYGGTGLGLAISKELTEKLGGHLSVESQLGVGSCFKILLPIATDELNLKVIDQKDNRKKLLIVEDDANFASILQSLSEEQGYEAIVVDRGEEAIAMAKIHHPMGIVLDLGLPDISGLDVVATLEKDPMTNHIPIHVISGREEEMVKLPDNVIGFLKKPVDIKSIYATLGKIESASTADFNHLLVVGPCGGESFEHFSSLANVKVDRRDEGQTALDQSNHKTYECAIVDMNLPDMSGLDFITALNKDKEEKMPVIVYTDKHITDEELKQVKRHTNEIILKSEQSVERLLGEVQQFINGFDNKIQQEHKLFDFNDAAHRVMVVDDDERNTFALSHLLESNGLDVIVVHNGDDCLKLLADGTSVELILMDIMMPVRDGYDTIKALRKASYGVNVPIIALTAKAMKEDRERCLAAGADDYLTKPIDTDLLMTKIKDWLNEEV